MDSNNKIGKYAEKLFSQWCTKEGIFCQSPTEDRTGWDFYLEFPLNDNPTPQDVHLPNIQCKVQIKGSTNVDGNRKLRLSTIRYMLNDPGPAFVIYIEFDDEKNLNPMKGYIAHLGEDLIRRGYELLITSDTPPSKLKLGVRKENVEEFKITESPASEIVEAIKQVVSEGPTAYIKWKTEFCQTVGYEEAYNISATLNNAEHLFSGQYVRADKFTIERRRFSKQVTTTDEGVLFVGLRPIDGDVFLRTPASTASFSQKARLFQVGTNWKITGDLFKITAEGLLVDYPKATSPLYKLRELIDFYTLCGTGGLSAEFVSEGMNKSIGNIKLLNLDAATVASLEETLETVYKIRDSLSVRGEINISVNDLVTQKSHIDTFFSVLEKFSTSFDGIIETFDPRVVDSEIKAVYLQTIATRFGNDVLIAFLGIRTVDGMASRAVVPATPSTDEKIVYAMSRASVVDKEHFLIEISTREEVKIRATDEYSRIRRKYIEDGYFVFDSNIEDLFSSPEIVSKKRGLECRVSSVNRLPRGQRSYT